MKLVAIRVKDRNKVLLHCYLNGNYWWYPAGRVEKGESLKDSARRELFERTGYWCKLADLKESGEVLFNNHKFILFEIDKIKVDKKAKEQTKIRFGKL